jgi:hypothetical protein
VKESNARVLRYVAVGLLSVSAVVHLRWAVGPRPDGGASRLAIYANPRTLAYYLDSGGVPDPRPFLFVGLVLAIVIGVLAVRRGSIGHLTAYAFGIVLVSASVGGWALWHTVLSHGVLLTAADPAAATAATGNTHGGVLHTLSEHAVSLPLEGATKTVELAALAVLAVLLWADPRAAGD